MNYNFHTAISSYFKFTKFADFNKTVIIKGFLGALALLLPIAILSFGVESKYLHTVAVIAALAPLFLLQRSSLFFLGGFSFLLWFYWINFSLYYYSLLWLAPLLSIAGFLYYGFLFWFIGFLSSKVKVARVFLVAFIFDYLSPFGFDWLKVETVAAYSLFGAQKYEIVLLLFGLFLIFHRGTILKVLGWLIVTMLIVFGDTKEQNKLPSLKIELISTDIAQDIKWNSEFKEKITLQNFSYIESAIQKGADLVVLPETAFPYFLNKADNITDLLKQKSHKIAILTGSLRIEGESIYNSSYFFKDGEMHIFDKVVAVPFGEVNPMPKIFSSLINRLFFDGAEDYKTAATPSDFEIGGVVFRNAICYEATNEKLYDKNPKFLVAISNNAWFLPSHEPIIQKMLLKHMSKKFNTVIFHTTNKSGSYIIN